MAHVNKAKIEVAIIYCFNCVKMKDNFYRVKYGDFMNIRNTFLFFCLSFLSLTGFAQTAVCEFSTSTTTPGCTASQVENTVFQIKKDGQFLLNVKVVVHRSIVNAAGICMILSPDDSNYYTLGRCDHFVVYSKDSSETDTSGEESNLNAYSISDMINHFNLSTNVVKEVNIQGCSKAPISSSHTKICNKMKTEIIPKIAEVSTYISDNSLIYRSTWSGKKDVGSHTYLTKTDIQARLMGDTHIGYYEDGLNIEDVFYPHVGRFYINANVSGDGDGYKKNRVCVLASPLGGCAKHATWSDDFDVDFYGDMQFDMIAGFVSNTKVVESSSEYIIMMQPKIRLLARESNIDIDYDISGISIFTSLASNLSAIDNLFDFSRNLATFQFDDAVDSATDALTDSAISLFSAFVFADDLSQDSYFKFLSEITTYFLDKQLDKATNRAMYDQEKALNDKLKVKLGLDADGLVMYRIPKF